MMKKKGTQKQQSYLLELNEGKTFDFPPPPSRVHYYNYRDQSYLDYFQFFLHFYSYALDTAALLGGNEYLIKLMLDEIEQLEYNEKELNVLKWALTEVIILYVKQLFPNVNEIIHEYFFSLYLCTNNVDSFSYGELKLQKKFSIVIVMQVTTKKISQKNLKPKHFTIRNALTSCLRNIIVEGCLVSLIIFLVGNKYIGFKY